MADEKLPKLPKKVLVIRDCTFFLPDNFEGNLEEAFDEFLRYREERDNQPIYVDPMNLFSSFNNLLLHRNTQSRVCGSYTLMELDEENNQYKVMEGTSPSNS